MSKKKAFVTEVEFDDEQDPLTDARLYNKQLCSLIEQIDVHFMQTLDEHEQDFTNAYMGQMLKVKREL